MRRVALCALAAVAACVAAAAATAADAVRVTPIGRVPFPERGYVVSVPEQSAPDSSRVVVRENGRVVQDLDVAPVTSSGLQVGVVLAIDASDSMRGRPAAAAHDAARAFVTRRVDSQKVGIVTFNSGVDVRLPLSGSTAALERALVVAPPLAYGTRIYDAIDTSLRLLARAGLSSGSIVLLSDGADLGSTRTIADVITKARAAHVRVFTVGLRSGSFDFRPLRTLADATGGAFVETADSGRLVSIYADLSRRFASEYVIRYRSDARPRSHVGVTIAVGGIGAAAAEYVAPTPAGVKPYHRSAVSRLVTSPAAPFALSLLVAALASLLVIAFLRPRRSTLVERVGEFAVHRSADAALPLARGTAIRRLRTGSRRLARLQRDLEIARMDVTALRLVAFTAAATVVLAIAFSLAAPVFAVLALLAPLAARSIVQTKLRKVREEFADQLAPNLQVLASALRIGHGFVGSLRVVVDNADEPSQSELRRALSDEQLGVPMEEAIRRVAERMKSRDLEQVALLAELQRTVGGNAAEVLDVVVETLRERADLRRLVSTLTAQGRLARWILSVLPLAAGLLFAVVQPAAITPLLHSGTGQAALVFAALLVTAGSLTIQKIVDIKV
jgi:tight adherence protein B